MYQPEADLEFASRVFSGLRGTELDRSTTIDTLLPAFFVLDRYCARRPDDASALHLFGLVCERLGHVEAAMELMERAIAILESVYEETEDVEVERRFVMANSNLARLRLGRRDWEGAGEAWGSALGLLPEEKEGEERILRAQAQFGLGLVEFMKGNLEGALAMFGAALESAGDDLAIRGHVTVLLTQAMWAVGTEDFRETAKAQLLEWFVYFFYPFQQLYFGLMSGWLGSITADPENLAAINTLAGMGILTDDEGLVDAALSEILALPFEKKRALDPGRDVDYLLTQNYLRQVSSFPPMVLVFFTDVVCKGDIQKAIGVAQGTLFADPAHTDVRLELARLMVQGGEYAAAGAVSAGAETSGNLEVAPRSLRLRALARALEIEGACSEGAVGLRETQRAIMLDPSSISGWQALAYIRSSLGVVIS